MGVGIGLAPRAPLVQDCGLVIIHAISTGTVAIKTRQAQGVGHGTRRIVNTLLDRSWTEPLPIHAYAIEHPEGVIVVDAGETARTSEPGYFPRWHPFHRYTEQAMLHGICDGVSPDEDAARLTHERIRALAAQTRTVYLVAHDPETPVRLAERRPIPAAPGC
jgi:hypothetical protein